VQIIHYPHPTLRHKSKPLRKVDAELRAMVARMFELMYEHKGVGLAANQVDLPYRLFVMNPTGDPAKKDEERVMINPIISGPKGSEEGEEGCLSLPQLYADVKRPAKIMLNAYDLDGNEFHGEVEGYFARIVQHETDHLDGRLFIDRLPETVLADFRDDLDEMIGNFRGAQSRGTVPNDAAIAARLAELERART
jgi:peptide deformylase